MAAIYCYVWDYDVRPESTGAFEAAYGPHGTWSQLFERDKQYVRTELLRDRDRPGHYMTIDYWLSRDACETFRARHKAEFEAIDRTCEALTVQERHLGDFDL
jgi:hypothetical protein